MQYIFKLLCLFVSVEEESGDFTVTCISYENAGVFIVTAIADISLSSSFGPKEVFCSGANTISNGNNTGTVITISNNINMNTRMFYE